MGCVSGSSRWDSVIAVDEVLETAREDRGSWDDHPPERQDGRYVGSSVVLPLANKDASELATEVVHSWVSWVILGDRKGSQEGS